MHTHNPTSSYNIYFYPHRLERLMLTQMANISVRCISMRDANRVSHRYTIQNAVYSRRLIVVCTWLGDLSARTCSLERVKLIG